MTLIVAATGTASFGVHLVSVDSGLDTLIVYWPGVRVMSPALSSFSFPFISDSTIGLFLGMGGFCRGPSIETVPVPAPPTVRTPVGLTVSAPRSSTSGFFEAAWTVFQTISTSSPT